MLELWREMSWYRRVLLAVLAAMVVGFGIATPVVRARKGMEYRDTLFYPGEEAGVLRYTGRLDWERAEFTVRPGGLVEYRWGEEVYGPYTVAEDPAASPSKYPGTPGIEVRQGEEVLFRGGYFNDYMLIREDGELLTGLAVRFETGDGGRELTRRDLHEPGLSQIVRLALGGTELTHRGSFGLYLLVTLLAAFNIFQICCPGLMFRLSLWGRVRDPYAAEPSEWYILMERLEWIVLTAVVLAGYWMALTMII